MSRRGLTLVEMLIGMVLLAMLGMAITETLATASRATTRALRALVVGRTVVAAATLLREELGQSSATELTGAAPTSLDFGRTIGAGPVCAASGFIVRVRQSAWWEVRAPVGGRDEVALLADPVVGSWATHPIDTVTSAVCPDGAAAIRLVLSAPVAVAAYARVIEPVRLKTYLSGGSGWWGIAGGSGLPTIQPFAGPLAAPLQPFTLTATMLQWRFKPSNGSDTVVTIPLGAP